MATSSQVPDFEMRYVENHLIWRTELRSAMARAFSFCIFRALLFEPNLFFHLTCPLKYAVAKNGVQICTKINRLKICCS